MFSRTKKWIQVWNYSRGSKWWQSFHFWVNYPFNYNSNAFSFIYYNIIAICVRALPPSARAWLTLYQCRSSGHLQHLKQTVQKEKRQSVWWRGESIDEVGKCEDVTFSVLQSHVLRGNTSLFPWPSLLIEVACRCHGHKAVLHVKYSALYRHLN